MAASSASLGLIVLVCLIYTALLSVASAQTPAPAPSPKSDGTSVDQAVAYLLMVVALVLTYLIH